MNWLDLGLILFIILFIFIGFRKGFMTSLLSSFSFKINAIISFFLCKPISFLLNKIFNLKNIIANNYASKLIESSADFSKNLLEIPEGEFNSFISNTINNSGFSNFTNKLTNLFLNKSSLYSTLQNSNYSSRTLSDIISTAYASFFVTIISFVTSILLIYFIVWILGIITTKLREIGFIKIVDNILGVFYSLFRCLLIFIVLSLIIKLLTVFSFMSTIINYINSSAIGRFIYGQINNFIDNYLNFSDLFHSIFK